jgi:acetoacetate decarboxylase
MKKSEVLQLPSMPLQSPTFPRGPFRFFKRQYLIIGYRTDPDAIREALPEPLELEGDEVSLQWLDLPDGEGFGAYSAAAQVIPCRFQDKSCNFITQMYVDNTSPLAGGREIWGYPMKHGLAKLDTASDTLTGTLRYAGVTTAIGTMTYKHTALAEAVDRESALLGKTQVTLKIIPGVDGRPEIAQLIGIRFTDVQIIGAWTGQARLELHPSVNCTLADLPVRSVTSGLHMVTHMTLPYGELLHDYLA